MKKFFPIFIIFCLCTMMAKAQEVQSLKGKTILFVYGGWDGHEPKQCHDLLVPWMESEGAKVISSDNLDVYTDEKLMDSIDLIVQCWTMGTITPAQERGLLKAVREGKGIAGWHGGTADSFRNNTDYQFMIGGQWVAHPGNVIDYDVKITNHNEEVTRGLKDFHMHSEQYYMHVDPNVEVLATTTFVNNVAAPWISGHTMPVVWKTYYGKGKVFYSSLGHVAKDFEVSEALEIMKRGIRWASQQLPEPVVAISSGSIEGVYAKDVFAFKGIPYAEAERFQPSHPVTAWDGVRECKVYGPWAKQAENEGKSMEGAGDFLANVWTTGLNDGGKRPIMFWIHGGGFSVGSANADPTDGIALAKKGAVVVSINHRLDVMGFLDLSSFGGKWKKSVNVGMLDIVNALKWVKENAEAFGGDPDNITIFGESGGGGKVGTLLCMPEAKGLFQKAIIQSGAKINITTSEVSKQLGKNVVKELGLTAKTLDKINTIDFETLLAASRKCQAEILGARTPGSIKMWGFCPTADGNTLLQQPYTPGFSTLAHDIPIMIGTTFNELERKFYTDKSLDQEKADKILQARYGDEALEYAKAFREAYPDGTLADMLGTDSNIRTLTLATADAKSSEGGAPVYVYLLKWVSDYDTEGSGCYHSLDIPLCFNNPYDERYQVKDGDPKAASIAERMSDLWFSFARTGKPEANGVPEWNPYTKENGATLVLDNECKLKFNYDRKLQDFLYKKLK